MPRPTTKSDLIAAAEDQFKKLNGLIDSMSKEGQAAAFNFGDTSNRKEAHWGRDKNIRDVLIHLCEWHQLLLNWVKNNQSGKPLPFLPEPYTWKTYGQMNVGFWEKHQKTSYKKSREMLSESHTEVLKLVKKFSNEELFNKKHFSWTGTTTLGSYCVSATSSHYDWAIKKVKEHIKTCKL